MRLITLALSLVVVSLLGTSALAADCPARNRVVTACQDAIGNAGLKYVASHLKAVQRCLLDFQRGKLTGVDAASTCRGTLTTPPADGRTADALAKARAKAADAIEKKCSDASVASLDLCAATAPAAAACLVDQHWQQADTAIADEVGALVATDDTGLQQCQAAVVKEAGKFLDAKAKVLARCLAKRQKVCGTASPSIRCFGGSASGPKV